MLPTRPRMPVGFWLALLACAGGSFVLVYVLNSGAAEALLRLISHG
jgi:lipid-A-disaccharide synthase-like uncharacterized protein